MGGRGAWPCAGNRGCGSHCKCQAFTSRGTDRRVAPLAMTPGTNTKAQIADPHPIAGFFAAERGVAVLFDVAAGPRSQLSTVPWPCRALLPRQHCGLGHAGPSSLGTLSLAAWGGETCGLSKRTHPAESGAWHRTIQIRSRSKPGFYACVRSDLRPRFACRTSGLRQELFLELELRPPSHGASCREMRNYLARCRPCGRRPAQDSSGREDSAHGSWVLGNGALRSNQETEFVKVYGKEALPPCGA
jgi:hypothetical protein